MTELSAKRINRIPYILLIALILISLQYSPWFQPFGYDREIYRYAGMLIKKGYVPYVDFFDHKPPGIYIISAIAHFFRPWGFWLVSNTLTFITSIVIFRFVRGHFATYSFILVIPLIFIFLSRYEPLYEGGALTREFTQTFAALIIFYRPQKQGLRFFIIGLLYALIFFTQQNEILAITVIGAYFILWDAEQKRFKKIGELFIHGLIFGAGAILISAVICGYLYFNGAFDLFIEQAFKFNTEFYAGASYYDEFSDTWLSYYYMFPNFTLFAILYLLFARKNKNIIEYSVFFIAMFVQLCASSMGHHFGHYYLSFIPYFCYTSFFALTHFEEKLDIQYRHFLAYAIFFLFILPMPILLRVQALAERQFWPYYSQRGECYDMVKDVKGKDGQLFVFRNPAYLALNTDLNCASESELLYFHFYSEPEFDKDNKMFYEMIATLKKNKCKYIIDFSGYKPIEREELQKHWNGFINSDYHVIHENIGNYRVLQIN